MFDSPEKKIKKQILANAKRVAEETYQKDVMFRSLQTSDLHYAIIADLMKAANFTGEVRITLKDGTIINIKPDVQKVQDMGELY